jgi:hypothetical protein
MAVIAWNNWPLCHGSSGRLRLEWVAGIRGIRKLETARVPWLLYQGKIDVADAIKS